MTERQALLGAGLAHLLLFAALSIGWAWHHETPPIADETTPVEFVEIADAPRVTEAPKPSMQAAPQETSAPEPKPPEPKPPEPKAEVPPEPSPDAKAEPKPRPKAEKPPPMATEAKPLDTSFLSNLIDKALPKARTKPLDVSKLATSIGPATPRNAVIDPRAAATLIQAIRAQVAPCWNPPIGGADVRKMTVVIRADFGRDGRVLGQPSVVSQTGKTAGNGDYARAFAETAQRALLRCSPLKLPADKYDLWKSVEINFDPESMT